MHIYVKMNLNQNFAHKSSDLDVNPDVPLAENCSESLDGNISKNVFEPNNKSLTVALKPTYVGNLMSVKAHRVIINRNSELELKIYF